jgi:hypothetical protein
MKTTLKKAIVEISKGLLLLILQAITIYYIYIGSDLQSIFKVTPTIFQWASMCIICNVLFKEYKTNDKQRT